MISYESLYKYSFPASGTTGKGIGDIHRFRRVAREGFNATDSPDTRFFKLLFYFVNDEENSGSNWDHFIGGESGLLAPTWLKEPTANEYYKYNSAWAYLKNNYEDERADALEQFVNLLSNISTESPWYFKEITGVDEAMTREKWEVGDERKKITIKCMNDPMDHRIESLLSLYRSIVWSHVRKCEVLPANLRKFDMGLFVFSGLFTGMFVQYDYEGNQYCWSRFGNNDQPLNNAASYKYIEFHNCEISIDSIKSGFSSITNEAGFEQEFSIDIYFDDCYENEYNQFIMRSFGDFFVWDAWSKTGIDENGGSTGEVPDYSNFYFNNESDLDEYNSTYNYDDDGLAGVTYFNNEENQQNFIKSLNIGHTIRVDNISGEGKPEKEPSLLEKMGNAAIQAANQATQAAKDIVRQTKNTLIDSITGGLGNIYGMGTGLRGATEAMNMELNKQLQNLKNKAIGNIGETINGVSRSLTNAVTAPVLGTIKTTGTFMGDMVDSVHYAVATPVMGAARMVEKTSVRASEAGLSYIDEVGNYVANNAKELGNIAYSTLANLPNSIGKNRLNASLGNIN